MALGLGRTLRNVRGRAKWELRIYLFGFHGALRNLPAPDVAALFEKSGVLAYLSDNAEILHTQGKNYILGSIKDFLKK